MRARIALISLVAAILSALLLAPALVFPYFEDAALFAAVANYMLEGETLYRDVFDHKAPAIYLQEMIRISLFGTSALASRVVELVFLFLAGLGLGASALALRSDDHQGPSLVSRAVSSLPSSRVLHAARGVAPPRHSPAMPVSTRLASDAKPSAIQATNLPHGTLALLLLLPVSFCAFTSSTIWILPDRGQVEFFQAAVVALGLSAALFSIALPDRRLPALVSGMALAWAAWLKPQASVLLVFFFLVLLWEGVRTNRGKRRAWDLTFGVVIVSVVVAVFVMISGSLDGFFHLFSKHHPAYLAGIRPVPSNPFDRFNHYFLSTPRSLVVAALTVLGTVRLAWLARRRSIRWASWLLIVGTLAWGLAAFASGVAGFRYHAVPAMVGVSVLVAFGLEGLLCLAIGTRGSWWKTVAGGTLLGLIGVWLIATPRFLVDTADLAGWWSGREALASVHERRGNEAHYYSYARELEASRIVREIVPEGQSIYVLGLAGVTYLLGDRPTAGRHLVTTFAYMPGYTLADSVHAEIVETLRDQQPELLLVRANDSFPWFGLPHSSVQRLIQDKELLPIVRRDYEPVSRIGDYFLIFRRRSHSS